MLARRQLEEYDVDSGFVYRRIRSQRWQRMLPGIVVTHTGGVSRRQRVVGAWLWAGEDAAIDGASACRWYGLDTPEANPGRVHVVVPRQSPARSQSFVVVRRALADIEVADRGLVAYVDPATAVIVAARGCRSERAAIAVLSRALQTELATVASLLHARERLGDKWCRRTDAALLTVGVGLRSPAERDNRTLVMSSRVLPEPLWNQWLDLGDGGPPVCVDALWADAALVEEVNGKRYHAWGQQFEDTESRRGRLVTAGLVVQGATPRQIRSDGPRLLDRLERTYVANRGRGLPDGVTRLSPPSMAS